MGDDINIYSESIATVLMSRTQPELGKFMFKEKV